jgi:P-type Ca2+ transporter type 2C
MANDTSKKSDTAIEAEDEPNQGSNASKFHLRSASEVERDLNTDLGNGLSAAEAEKRLQQYGTNTIESKPPRPAWAIFFDQFKSLIVVLLIAASALAFLLGETLEGFAILVVIVINAIIGFLTELRAQKAITALQEQTNPTAHVIRDSKEQKIQAAKLVPGDVVILAEGERVPADGRICEDVQLQIQEASLTGESLPVNKTSDLLNAENGDVPLGDRKNMAYMGTVVTDGRGRMLVTATGMDTEVGNIGTMIDEAETQETPLERRLEKLGRTLVIVVGVLSAVIVTAGVLRGENLLYMLEVGISLAIAAVPEGLPAVATMTLAIGVQRMARKNALMRRLHAVETLGSTTVICSDKTGTLTKNEMTVTRIMLNGDRIEVTGSGYELDGSFRTEQGEFDPHENEHLMLALRIGTLCNDAELEPSERGISVLGDPTEGALIVAAEKADLEHKRLEEEYERVDELPFDSETKRMVTVYRTPESSLVAYMKGAPAAVLESVDSGLSNGQTQPFTEKDRESILQLNQEMAEDALRVLAAAYRELPEDYQPEDLTSGFTYAGLFGMIDPLREEVKGAIEQCHQAGIRTIMITGDQPVTAKEIAAQLGLDRDQQGRQYQTVNARDLEGLDDGGWEEIAEKTGVFARVSPEHKLQIVEALQRQHQIVAMTGDGVNDAPALKTADIGVAMGIKGTEVAKETSDMIISDDNFATIVGAVEQGRMIYSNIQRFIHYLFSCNFSEILTVFTAIMIGWPLPLAPLQILWLNIITDVFPALALALEPSAPNMMKQKPRDPQENILNRAFAGLIVWQGLLLASVTLAAFALGMAWYGREGAGLRHALTIAFMTLALAQVFHAFNARSQMDSIFTGRLFTNRWLWGAVVLCILLQLAAVYVPFLQTVLRTVPLNLSDWGLVLGFSLLPVAVVELVKLTSRAVVKK